LKIKTTAIIVCSSEESEVIVRAVESLARQDAPPDQVVVVDNSPDGRHGEAVAGLGVSFHAAHENLGFPGGVNRGAELARGEFLFLLNPDAEAAPDCLARLLALLESRPDAAVAGAQVLLPDGRVNAGDNPIHLSGLCWAGNYLGHVESGPARPALSVSGAAMLIRSDDFRRLGGFSPAIFMYFDDADLCWRAALAGRSVLFCPEATVEHDYSFDKGPGKWKWLEESRLSAVFSNYGPGTLILLGPLLVATELAIWLASLRGGWARQKLLAYRSLWRRRAVIRQHRLEVQSSRLVSDARLLPHFAPVVDTPILDSPLMRLAAIPQGLYARIACAVLRVPGRSGGSGSR
jgi:GT2 family glycosyltransferase